MAIINSYPLATPKLTDLIIGTSASSSGKTSTKNFTVQSINDIVGGVKTIITTTPTTLAVIGERDVTINTITGAVTDGGTALTTGNDVYDFVVGKITGTPNTVPIWTDATTLGDSLISQANNSIVINGSGTDGRIQLNCSATTHGVGIQSPPHSAGATYDWILPQSAGTAGQVLTSGGGTADQLSWTDNGNVAGTGTQNKLSKWTNATTLADSNIEDTGSLVSISSGVKVTGNLELDADLIDVNGGTGTAGQLLSSLGTGNGVDWIDGVLSVADGNTTNNQGITIAGTVSNPTVAANTAAVTSTSKNLATGEQIQTAIDQALAGAITFKGTFNATTGAIIGGGNLTDGVSRVAVAVGDMYVVVTAGDFYGNAAIPLNVGDEVIAVLDAAVGTSDENDWNAVPSSGGSITGSGTTNKVPLWAGQTALTDSAIAQSGTNIGIGTTSPDVTLHSFGAADVAKFETTSLGGVSFSRENAVGNNSTHYVASFNNSDSQVAYIKTLNKTGATTSTGTGYEFQLGALGSGYQTFYTNGSERMRIDSSGNVGIGMTPSKLLDLQATDNLALRYYNSTTFKAGIEVATTAGDMISTSAVDDFAIRSNSNILFASGGNIEKMRIDSSGRVGIGTTSPVSNLDVKTSGTTILTANTTGFTTAGDGTGFGVYRSNTGRQSGYSWTIDSTAVSGGSSASEYQTDSISFNTRKQATDTSLSEVMRITNGGNVGIGTDSPDSLLNILGNTGATNIPRIKLEANGWSNDCRIERSSGSDGFYITNNYDTKTSTADNTGAGTSGVQIARGDLRFHTGSSGTFSEAMRIDSSGRVGVGTTSINSKVQIEQSQQVSGAFSNPFIKLSNSAQTNNTGQTSIALATSTADNYGYAISAQRGSSGTDSSFIITHHDNSLTGTPRMAIDSSGNVGIGTTTPESVLHTKQANATILVQDTDTAFSTTEAYIKFSGTDGSGNFRTDIEKAIGSKDNSLVFEHVGSETMRIDSSGNVGIGTTSPSAPLSFGKAEEPDYIWPA